MAPPDLGDSTQVLGQYHRFLRGITIPKIAQAVQRNVFVLVVQKVQIEGRRVADIHILCFDSMTRNDAINISVGVVEPSIIGNGPRVQSCRLPAGKQSWPRTEATRSERGDRVPPQIPQQKDARGQQQQPKLEVPLHQNVKEPWMSSHTQTIPRNRSSTREESLPLPFSVDKLRL